MTYEQISEMAMALGGVSEHVKKTEIDLNRDGGHIARLRTKGTVMAFRLPWDLIDELLAEHPDTFFVTSHYQGHPYLLAKIASLDKELAKRLVFEAWDIAPFALPTRAQRS